MKKIVLLILCLVFLTACSSYKVYQAAPEQADQGANEQQNQQAQQQAQLVNVTLNPEFRIIAQQATRNPPIVSGTVENKGLGAGDVKIIAAIYYGGVVVSERNQVIENIKSKESANFSIEFDRINQWTSYSVVTERN